MQSKKEKEIPKEQKSVFWMVKQVIFHLIGFEIGLGVPLIIILLFLGDKIPDLATSFIILFANILIVFIAIKMAFKVIANKTSFSLSQVFKTARAVVFVAIIIQAVTIFYNLVLKSPPVSPPPLTLISQLVWDSFLFFAVYFWGKRYLNQNKDKTKGQNNQSVINN